MTTDLEFSQSENVRPQSVRAWADGQPGTTGPKHRRPATTSRATPRWAGRTGSDAIGQFLIAGCCLLLAGLAVAMGITSFHAQFTYIFATKRQWTPALLEALGLDAGAVIFALLGIALARLGRRAAVERVLVVICALGSCGMNVLNANLGSPRSIAVYAMPPVLFALTSDRLIAVVRRAALGKAADDDIQRSAWHLAGRSFLYGLRFAVDRRGTAKGLRQAILDVTPLPQPSIAAAPRHTFTRAGGASPAAGAPTPAAFEAAANDYERWPTPTQQIDGDGNGGPALSHLRKGTKTARFLAMAQESYGPLAEFDPANVYRVSAELAPRVRLNAGSARAALRAAVLAAKDGTQ
jgi:hypothetical protein